MAPESGTDDRYRPARALAFTQTEQIGIVVRDLDATLRRYVGDYGIGPWEIFRVGPENAPDLLHDGETVKGAVRSAVAMIGSVMWETLDEQGIFARFLAEKGGKAFTTSPSTRPISTASWRSNSPRGKRSL